MKSTTPTPASWALAASIALATPAWAAVNPISDPGGPFGVLSGGSLSLDGSDSLPSDTGTTITTYEWDLDGNDDFADASGANPVITYADLTTTWGMASGANTIKLRVTDDSGTPLQATASATVYIDGTVYIGPNSTGSQNTWNSAGNWDGGSVPSGTVDAIVPAGKYVVPWDDATPTYDGDLTLGAGSTVQVGWTTNRPNSYNFLGTAGSTTITLGDGALIKGRTQASPSVPAIVLQGDVTFSCGESTQTPASPNFGQPITGTHSFTIQSNASGPTVLLGATNTFSDLVIKAISGRGGAHGTVKATAAGSLGNGAITIEPVGNLALKLEFDIAGASSLANTLNVNGKGPSGDGSNRIQMDADNTVGFLNVDGFAYPAGTYGRIGSPGTPTNEVAWISGDSVLTVDGAPVDTDPPVVSSITDPYSGFTTNLYVGDTVPFTLTFDEVVSSTATTADFENAETVGAATVTIDSVTQTDVNEFQVVATATSTGAFTLGAKASAAFDDLFGNTLNGPFSDDTSWTVLAGSPGTITITGTDGGNDSWNTGTNWDSGFTPFGAYPAAIADGVTAKVQNASTPTYSGGLTIGAGSELDVKNTGGSETSIGTGTVTFNSGSTLRLRCQYTVTVPGDLVLAGDALITNSDNSTDNRTRTLNGDISGTGSLTVGVRRGNTLNLTGTNTWSGGFVFNYLDSNFSNGSKVVPGDSGMGTGDVTINDGLQLWLTGTTDAIHDSASLFLNGRGRNNSSSDRKLRLDSSETVNELWLDNTAGDGSASVQLAAGDYTATTSPGGGGAILDSAGLPLITGSGTLNVLSGPGGGTTYASWLSGFTLTDTTFTGDDDGDGLGNGIEGFFGTDPGVSNTGLAEVSKSGSTVTFTHPNPDAVDVLTDVTGSYEWSPDLVTWYAADGAAGPGVTTVTTVATPDSPTANTTTVVATIAGTVPEKLFLRVLATQP